MSGGERKPSLELVIRGTDTTALYACGECGIYHSPAIYACTSERAHEIARKAADDCCAPRHCECGAPLEKWRTACSPCWERNKLLRCSIVSDYTGPVEADGYEGGWGEGYFADVANLLESCAVYEVDPPSYCHPCSSSPLQIDLDQILETACEEQHEDACDQIVGADALALAVDAFNKAQTCVTYYRDHSRVIVLDAVRFAELIAAREATS